MKNEKMKVLIILFVILINMSVFFPEKVLANPICFSDYFKMGTIMFDALFFYLVIK